MGSADREQNTHIVKNDKADNKILLSVCAMALIPLLVHIAIVSNRVAGSEWFSGNDTEIDFFLVFKSAAVFIVAIVMIFIMCLDMIKHRNVSDAEKYSGSVKTAVIMMGAYGLFAVISGITAHSMADAWLGGMAQHEPVPVVLGYLVIFLYSYKYLNDKKTLILLYRLFLAGAVIIALTGVMQFVRHDIFMTDAVKSILTSFSSISPDRITLKFDPGMVYMTLYNPNYAGSYVALVLPFVAAGVLFGGKVQRIICTLISASLIICLVGSDSATGIAGVMTAGLIIIICIIKNRIARTVIIAVATLAVCIGSVMMSGFLAKDDFVITEMNVSDNDVRINYKGTEIIMRLEDGQSGLMPDGAEEKMPVPVAETADGTPVTLPYDELYAQTQLYDEYDYGFKLTCRDISLDFVKKSDGYYFRNIYGNDVQSINNSKKACFKDHDRFGNGRGFIWSRTVPLISKYLFSGCGQDNFIYVFPNDDYLSLLNNHYPGQVITRPHSMYLQTGIQNGVIALILFLGVYVVYFIQSIKIYAVKYMRGQHSSLYIIGLSILAGVTGYMVAGLANDSTVCVAPVFWVLLGTGFAVNVLMEKTDT